MKKKIYCDICGKYFSNRSSHNKTNTHKLLSLSVVIRFYNFRGYIEIRYDYFCNKIDLGWLNLLFVVISDEIIKRYKCNKKELVDLKIMFITGLDYQSCNPYLHQPRPMIEICKLIDRNPNLMKTLDKLPTPYSRHIIIKHWAYKHFNPCGIIQLILPDNWENLEPNINTQSPLLSFK